MLFYQFKKDPYFEKTIRESKISVSKKFVKKKNFVFNFKI